MWFLFGYCNKPADFECSFYLKCKKKNRYPAGVFSSQANKKWSLFCRIQNALLCCALKQSHAEEKTFLLTPTAWINRLVALSCQTESYSEQFDPAPASKPPTPPSRENDFKTLWLNRKQCPALTLPLHHETTFIVNKRSLCKTFIYLRNALLFAK